MERKRKSARAIRYHDKRPSVYDFFLKDVVVVAAAAAAEKGTQKFSPFFFPSKKKSRFF